MKEEKQSLDDRLKGLISQEPEQKTDNNEQTKKGLAYLDRILEACKAILNDKEINRIYNSGNPRVKDKISNLFSLIRQYKDEGNVKDMIDPAKKHSQMGSIFYAERYYEDAADEFEKAISIDPDDAVTHFKLGFVLGKMNYFKKAAEEYRKAIRIKPNYEAAHRELRAVSSKI